MRRSARLVGMRSSIPRLPQARKIGLRLTHPLTCQAPIRVDANGRLAPLHDVDGAMRWRATHSLLALMLCVVVTAIPQPLTAQSAPPGGQRPSAGAPPGGPASRVKPRRPKPPKPISREEFDKSVARQHREADSDRNGYLTVAETRAAVQAIADRAIQDRFVAIDSNRDDAIDRAEFMDWQRAMGSQVLSDESAAAISRGMIPSSIAFDAGSGVNARIISRLVRPVDAALVAQADTDYDGRVDLQEWQAIQGRSFERLDANSDDFLVYQELPIARGNRAERAGSNSTSNPVPPSRPTGSTQNPQETERRLLPSLSFLEDSR